MDHRDNQLINRSTLQEKPDLRKHGEPDQVGYLDWSLKQRVLSTRFGYDIFLIKTHDDIPANRLSWRDSGSFCWTWGLWRMVHVTSCYYWMGWSLETLVLVLLSHNDNAGSYRQKTPNFSKVFSALVAVEPLCSPNPQKHGWILLGADAGIFPFAHVDRNPHLG